MWGGCAAVRLSCDAGSGERFSLIEDARMLVFQIAGGLFVLLFLAAAMTGIEGNELR